MSDAPAQRRIPWVLALLWTSPLVFFLWWFYITSPAPETIDVPEFHVEQLSKTPEPLSAKSAELLTAQNQALEPLLQQVQALDMQLEAQQLWVLTAQQLQRYQWPELTLQQSSAVPAGASKLTLWQQQPVLASANLLYQQDPQQQWQPIWRSQGRIDQLQAVGSALIYQDSLPQADIWLLPGMADKPQLKLGSSRAELLPVQNQQGTLAYISRGAAEDEIWLRPAGQNPYRLLSLPPSITALQLAWSADNQWIWLLDSTGLYRLSPTTQQLQLIWQVTQPVQQFALQAEQTALLLSAQQLFQLDLQTGTLTATTTPATVRMQSDQQQIYLQLAGKDGLWQWSEHGIRQIQAAQLPHDTTEWQLATNNLWYNRDGQLHQQSLTEPTTISTMPLPAGFSALWSVGPDGLWYSKKAEDLTGIYQLQPQPSQQ